MAIEVESPTPRQVVDLVMRLSHCSWPTGDDETVAWFRHHGLPGTGERRQPADPSGPSFDGPAAATWPAHRFGWHTFRGEVVGVSWFLWDNLARDDVRSRAYELKKLLDGHFGPAADETPEVPEAYLGFTALWTKSGRTVEMYFHTGLQYRPDGQILDGSAVVQLHLDDTQRSHAKEAVARQNARTRSSPPTHQ